MQRVEQAKTLRELARRFEKNPGLEFTCNEVYFTDYKLFEEYVDLFELETPEFIGTSNAHEIWYKMTPQERQDQRVMMLCFMAAIIEEKRQPVRGPG